MPGRETRAQRVAADLSAASWWGSLSVALIVADDGGRITQWGMAAESLLGYSSDEVLGRDGIGLVAPEHQEAGRDLRSAVAEGRSVTGSVPVRHKNGSLVELEVWACPMFGEAEGGRGLLFLAADARAAQKVRGAHALLDGLFAGSPVGLAVFDADLRFQQVNPALEAMNGVPREEHLGRRLGEVLPGVNSDQMEAAMRRVLVTGHPVINFRRIGRTPASERERVWFCSYFRIDDPAGTALGVSASIIDVTAHQNGAPDTAVGRQRLEVLNESSIRVGTTLDVARTGQELTTIVVPRLASTATVDVLIDVTKGGEPADGLAGGSEMVRLGKSPAHGSAVADLLAPVGHLLRFPPAAPYAKALTDRRPFLLPFIDADTIAPAARHTPTPERLLRHGVHSMLMVPLVARGLVFGTLTLLREGDSPPFDSGDLDVVTDLASHAALCIDNARLYHREHDTALTLQRSMLRRPEPPEGIEIAHRYKPASDVNEVGGDWYDLVDLGAGRASIVIGDVMGHGISAAAVMGQMRTTVRALAYLHLPPDQLLHHLDRTLQELDDPVIATCLYGVLDPAAGTCRLVRAGHPPPVLIPPDGIARLLDLPAGPPLGIGGIPYEATDVPFPPGSTLALFTDGLVEVRGLDLDDRLAELTALLTGRRAPLGRLCDRIFRRFAPVPAEDDIALLVVRSVSKRSTAPQGGQAAAGDHH
ncbi:SpoIIE family protein phosphatase [Streptomyces sp. NPDC058534]|uniref:SpoIIE family protein phosphatase n=1 Tax=Streptomyces sp. NPDC058534 TaxID=3346541 RepID=UPI00364C88AB